MPVFEEFTFPSSTGENTIHCLKCLPDGAPRGVVQIEHGIAEHMDRYRDFMAFLAENGFENDLSSSRLHHEIYLSDARKVAPEKWKTVIRHPIRRKGGEG